jgi:hypothetical protein
VFRTMHRAVPSYARREAFGYIYVRLLVWWYSRPCHSFNERRTKLYGRRCVRVVETLTHQMPPIPSWFRHGRRTEYVGFSFLLFWRVFRARLFREARSRKRNQGIKC